MDRQHAVATICTAVPMVTSVTWWLRHVTQNCSLFHSWRKCKAPPGKLASSLTLWFSAMYTDFAGSYQFCDFGPFLWNCGSYNSIFFCLEYEVFEQLFFLLSFFFPAVFWHCVLLWCVQGGKQCGLSWWKVSLPSESDLLSLYQWRLPLLSWS